MNPMPYLIAICAVFLSSGSFYLGYSHEKQKFDDFVNQTKAQAAVQKAVNDHIVAQHEKDKEAIHNDYQTRLADLRTSYGVSKRPSSNAMSTNASSARRTDGSPTYDQLASQCAETTLQLTELQEWIRRTQ